MDHHEVPLAGYDLAASGEIIEEMDTELAAAVVDWHSAPVSEVLGAVRSDPGDGLSGAEASRRLAAHGPNLIEGVAGPTRLQLVARQFADLLIWMLLAAAGISGLLLGDWIDAFAIMAIVILNAVLGYSQEARAEEALQRLKDMAAPAASVVRGGSVLTIESREVVVGDVLVLKAGDRVAADARVVHSVHLRSDESMLTGESMPTQKSETPVAASAGVGDRHSIVFAGTTVVAGRGRAVVVATGSGTQVGQIAGLLVEEEPPTPLQTQLDRMVRRLAALSIAAAVIVFAAGVVRSRPLESMFLTAVALAVAAIPEGLPAVTTVSLARGVQRMAEENALVRRLPAVEALGAAAVVCTDKTGTLTENRLATVRVELAGVDAAPRDLALHDPRVVRALEVAAVCNDSEKGPDGYIGDPTENALLVGVEEAGLDPEALRRALPRIDEVLFDSRRKRMTTLHREGSQWLVAMKGSPEEVANRSSHVLDETGELPLTPERRESYLEAADRLAVAGLRTLGFAYRVVDEEVGDLEAAESDLVLAGLVGLRDRARPEVAEAVAQARGAGVRVVMVTGDHQVTAESIAREVGIPPGDVMPGDRLRALSVEDLADIVESIGVYARVDPVDKVKIVKAWQSRGAVVAMTGDGVNDAPALRAADIGVAMGSGTDVAKDASSLLLADDNFSTIVVAIREGRRIFRNLRNVVHYLLSANTSEVLVMVIGFLVFGALGEPLLPVQLLWINLISDGLPALALGFDVPRHDVMKDAPGAGRNILSGPNLVRLVVQGSILALATIGALIAGQWILDTPWPETRTLVFTTLVVAQLLHAFNVRSSSSPTTGRQPINRLLVASIGLSLLIHVAIVYLPFAQSVFSTAPVHAAGWAYVLGLSAASFVTIRMINRWSSARRHRTAARSSE